MHSLAKLRYFAVDLNFLLAISNCFAPRYLLSMVAVYYFRSSVGRRVNERIT